MHSVSASEARISGDGSDAATPVNPLVSIIINNYNYGRFVRQAIESALAQTYSNTEVIIVDDGSRDDSPSIIREYAERATVIFKSNGGQASAFNVGIQQARGDLALLLDSDDYLFPDAIAECVSAFPTGYSRVYFRLRHIDEEGRPVQAGGPWARFRVLDGDVLRLGAASGDVYLGPPTSGNVFDLRILKSVVPIPEDEYRICADAFVLVRTSLKGPVKAVDKELGTYRLHGSNAFAAHSSLFSNPRRVKSQIDNFFVSQQLLRDAYLELGLGPPALPQSTGTFWLLHLMSAGLVWDVPGLAAWGISRRKLLWMAKHYARGGKGTREGLASRLLRSAYIHLLLLLPRFFARRVLSYADARAYHEERAAARACKLAVGLPGPTNNRLNQGGR